MRGPHSLTTLSVCRQKLTWRSNPSDIDVCRMKGKQEVREACPCPTLPGHVPSWPQTSLGGLTVVLSSSAEESLVAIVTFKARCLDSHTQSTQAMPNLLHAMPHTLDQPWLSSQPEPRA